MSRQALDNETIKYILELLDKREYTQRELAQKYGVTQGTISRYNRIKRLQFRVEENSKLIAKLNNEIFELKRKYNLNMDEELEVPDSFLKMTIATKQKLSNNSISGKKLEGFFSKSYYDCARYIIRHPEFNMYVVTYDKYDDPYPKYIRSKARKNIFGFFLTLKDLGKINSENKIKIFQFMKVSK